MKVLGRRPTQKIAESLNLGVVSASLQVDFSGLDESSFPLDSPYFVVESVRDWMNEFDCYGMYSSSHRSCWVLWWMGLGMICALVQRDGYRRAGLYRSCARHFTCFSIAERLAAGFVP